MSAVPSHLRLVGSFAGQTDRGPRWIELDEASDRSDLSVGQLRRLAKDVWQPKGYARQERPADGGKPRWLVREDADPRLASVKSVEQMSAGFDLLQLPERHRKTLLAREQIVLGWDEARAAGLKLGWGEQQVTDHYVSRVALEHGETLSRRTLYNWRKAYREEGRGGLVSGSSRSEQADSGTPVSLDADPFLAEVRRYWLHPARPSVAACVDHAKIEAVKHGWRTYTLRHVRRLLAKIPRATVIKLREGEKSFVDKVKPFIGRDYSTIESNDVWGADHHRLDVMVAHEGKVVRPWLTAWQDLRSRRFVGWSIYAHDPNTDSILATFRAAVLEFGVPREVQIDNGKDFDARALQGVTKRQRRASSRTPASSEAAATVTAGPAEGAVARGVFPALGVRVRHVEPYHGQSKPIERSFRTVKERFCKFIDGYCGGRPDERPEVLARHLKNGNLLTLDELRADFGEWVEGDYHDRAHDGDGLGGRTPREVYDEHLATKRTAPAELLDYLCSRRAGPVLVRQNGVTWQGVAYGQYEPRLAERFGDKVVLVIDERDASKVIVADLEDRPICVARANERLPVNATAQQVREAKASIRKSVKAVSGYHEHRPKLADSPADRMVRLAAERRQQAAATQPQPTPPNIQPVGTQQAADFRALEGALDVGGRVAVGAERLSLAFDADAAMRRGAMTHTYDGRTDAPDYSGTEAGPCGRPDGNVDGGYDVLDLMQRAVANRRDE